MPIRIALRSLMVTCSAETTVGKSAGRCDSQFGSAIEVLAGSAIDVTEMGADACVSTTVDSAPLASRSFEHPANDGERNPITTLTKRRLPGILATG